MLADDFSTALIPVSVELELRFGTHSERVRGILVGQKQSEFLIIEVSKKHNWVEVQTWFHEAASVVIRGVVNDGRIVAGLTEFIAFNTRPQRIVYLSYPKQLESRMLRQAPRIDVELDAILRAKPGEGNAFPEESGFIELKGIVNDVSRGGLSFSTQLSEELNIEDFNAIGVEIEVYDENETLLKAVAETRAARVAGEHVIIGLLVNSDRKQFVDSLDHLILHSKSIKKMIQG